MSAFADWPDESRLCRELPLSSMYVEQTVHPARFDIVFINKKFDSCYLRTISILEFSVLTVSVHGQLSPQLTRTKCSRSSSKRT